MEKKWYAFDKSFVLNDLNSRYDGLSSNEAKERIKKYGKNELPKKKRDSFFKLLIKGLLDPIVIILVITIVFSFIINEKFDAYAIMFIMVVDLIIGATQEWSASKTADSLSKLIRVNNKVIRDGKLIEILSLDLTIGDVILLESGDKISCDARILESTNLQVDESTLTGESANVANDCAFWISVARLDCPTYLINCGANTPTNTAIMAITIINSTREKPLLFKLFCFLFIIHSPFHVLFFLRNIFRILSYTPRPYTEVNNSITDFQDLDTVSASVPYMHQ